MLLHDSGYWLVNIDKMHYLTTTDNSALVLGLVDLSMEQDLYHNLT